MVDELTFRGDGKFEIALQSHPTASAEGEIVTVTLRVFAAGFPQQTARIDVPLSPAHAEELDAQLRSALKTVRSNSGKG